MEKRKMYERPSSTCTAVMLESPICNSSGKFQAQSPIPTPDNIEAHMVNTAFETSNTFTNNSDWDLGE